MSFGASAALVTAPVATTPVTGAFVIPGPEGRSPQVCGHSTAKQLVARIVTQEAEAGWTASTPGACTLLTAAATCSVLAAAARRSAVARRLRASNSTMPRRFFGGGGTSYAAPVFDPANELGVQDPIGFWDPLGLAADKDEAAFKRRRSVELKHGRVCMIACIGYIVPEYFKWPGEISPSLGLKFADIPNGLAALSQVPALGWVQIVFFAGIMEGCFGVGEYKTGTPGEYGWKVITSDDPEEKKKKLSAEIANGRLAMVAIIGMFFQDGLTGSAWGDWANYTDSPLRAFKD